MQLTTELDKNLTLLFKNLLRTGKQNEVVRNSLFRWLGSCLHANRTRKQLANTLGGGTDDLRRQEQQFELASDGFLNNLASLMVRLCQPLLTPSAAAVGALFQPKSPLNLVRPAFVVSQKAQVVLPGKASYLTFIALLPAFLPIFSVGARV